MSFVTIYSSCIAIVHFKHKVHTALKHIHIVKRSLLYIKVLGTSLPNPCEMHFICSGLVFICNGLLLAIWIHFDVVQTLGPKRRISIYMR